MSIHFLHPVLGLVTSELSSLWQPAPENENDWHRGPATSRGPPTGLVLRRHQLVVAVHSHCYLR